MTIQSDLEAEGTAETKGSRPVRSVPLQTVNGRLKAVVEAKTAGNPSTSAPAPRRSSAHAAKETDHDLSRFTSYSRKARKSRDAHWQDHAVHGHRRDHPPGLRHAGNKILYLQKLLFDNGRTELRLGYHIIGKKGRTAGKWVWGQFAHDLGRGLPSHPGQGATQGMDMNYLSEIGCAGWCHLAAPAEATGSLPTPPPCGGSLEKPLPPEVNETIRMVSGTSADR